jgi:hypothetical protein
MASKEIKAELDMATRAAVTNDPKTRYNSIKNEIKFKLILKMFAVISKQKVYVETKI